MRILHKQQHLPPLDGPRLEPHPFRAAGTPPDKCNGAPLVPVNRRERGLEARRTVMAAEERGEGEAVNSEHKDEDRQPPNGVNDAFEFRQLGKDDFEQFEALLRYAFQVSSSEMARIGWSDKEMKQSKKPIFEASHVMGWFYKGRLASQVVIYPMEVNIQGEICKMGGITGVATYPEYTGRGLIHSLLAKSLEYMRSQQQIISYLCPYSIPLYRKHGWEIMSDKMTFAIKDTQEIDKLFALFSRAKTDISININSANFTCEHCVSAFLASAFLCVGTITNPEREYNLEFVTNKHRLSQDLCALLKGHDFLPGSTVRKGSNIIYFKASEQIEDLLTFIGASGAALEIMNLKVYKDFRNKANRITNCETANIDKMVAANSQTLTAIETLRKYGKLETLPATLREAAQKRLEFPDISLKELAACFEPPLSKSGLSHRLRKLEEMARDCLAKNVPIQ